MISTSRPLSWAASRIAWRQPPQGVTVPSPDSAPAWTLPPATAIRATLCEAEGELGGGERALLGADAEAVAGILDIDPGDDPPVDALDRAADGEAGVGGIGVQRGGAGGGDQFFVGHGRGHEAFKFARQALASLRGAQRRGNPDWIASLRSQ